MTVPFFDLTRENKTLLKELEKPIREQILRGDFSLGQEVKTFEEKFSVFIGVKHCVGVASGTDALIIALRTLQIGPGDEVVVPVNTFIATALAVSYVGAKPVFADVEKDSFNLDPEDLQRKITKKTKAVMVVHLYGQPANMKEITRLANKHKLTIVEDCAQSHGAEFAGKTVGTFGKVAAFSFYPTKVLGAFGDAGAIMTDDQNLADQVRILRNSGRTGWYEHPVKGYNSKLDSFQAVILNVKLKHVRGWISKRQQIAKLYRKLITNPSILHHKDLPDRTHVYYQYIIRVKERDKLKKYLTENNIQTSIHYPIPLHLQGAYEELKHKPGDFPVAERISQEILSLPMFPELTYEEIRYVSKIINKFS